MLHAKEAEFDTLGFLDFYIVLTKVEGISNIKDYAQVKLALSKLIIGLSTGMLPVIASGIVELKKILCTNLTEYKQVFNIKGLNASSWLQEIYGLPDQGINEYVKGLGILRGKVLLEAYNARFNSIEKQLSAHAAHDEDETILGFYSFCIVVEEQDLLEIKEAIIKLLRPFLLKGKDHDSLFIQVDNLKRLLETVIDYSLIDQSVESNERQAVQNWIKFFMAIPPVKVSSYLSLLVDKIASDLKEKGEKEKEKSGPVIPVFIQNQFNILSRSEEINKDSKNLSSVPSLDLRGFWELYAALIKLPFLERIIEDDTRHNISDDDDEEYEAYGSEEGDETDSSSSEEDEESEYRPSLTIDYIQIDNDYRKMKYAMAKILASLIIANKTPLALLYFSEIKRMIYKHKTFFEQAFSSDSLYILSWIREISSMPSTKYIDNMCGELRRVYKVSDSEKAHLLPAFLKQKTNEVKSLPSELEMTCGTINTLAFYHFYAFITQRSELSRYIKNFQELKKSLDQFIESIAEEMDTTSIFFARIKKMILDNKPAFLHFNYQDNVKLLQWVLQIEKVASVKDAEYLSQLTIKIKLDIKNYSAECKATPKARLIQEMLAKETRAILRSLPEVNSNTPEFSKALGRRNQELKSTEKSQTFMLSTEALQERDPELFEVMRANEQRIMMALFQDDLLVENYHIYRSPQGIKKIPVYYITTEDRVFQTFLLYFSNHVNHVQKMLTSEGFIAVGKGMLELFEKRILQKKEEIEGYKAKHGKEPLNVHILFNDEQLAYAKENFLSIIGKVKEQIASNQQRSHEELTNAVDKYRFGAI